MLFSKTPIISFLCSARVFAAVDYAVYFDPSEDSRNPLQRAGSNMIYKPYAPSLWNKVDSDAWPIFSDWGQVLDETGPWYSRGNSQGNECENRINASYYDKHRQSPIMLQEDATCNDRHKMINEERGQCAKDEITFYTTPYGLGATVDCTIQPLLDHSLNDDVWTLQEIVVKTPGEHSIWNPETGEEDTFAGEIQLGYKGSMGPNKTGLEGHAENIGMVGILLKVGTNYDADNELEKLIQGWEKSQTNQYKTCNKEYDHNDCSLNISARSAGASDGANGGISDTRDSTGVTDQCGNCSECCNINNRNLMGRHVLTALSGLRGHDNLSETVRKQDQEIRELKSKLSQCNYSINADSQSRELGEWHRQCPNSHYCIMNLYKHTQTDYYYNYRGGLTYPPCTEIVYWRVMMQPMIISPRQLERLERLIYMHLNDECELATVGNRRGNDSCAVDVNRPRQSLSRQHKLKMCDSWSIASVLESGSGGDQGDDSFDDDDFVVQTTPTVEKGKTVKGKETKPNDKKKGKGYKK